MPGKKTSKPKGHISHSFLQIVKTNLLPLFAVHIAVLVGGIIIKRGFSLKVNILFFFWLLTFGAFVFPLNILLGIEKKDFKITHKIILSTLTTFCIFFSVWLFIECGKEPLKGTLIIRVDEESTHIPNEILMKRGFPGFLSFLETKKELEYDPDNNSFLTSGAVRCGKWFLHPLPADEFDPIKKPYNIPNKKPYKTRTRKKFNKRLCDVDFKTFSDDGEELKEAEIEIDPVPFDFNFSERTPCSMKLEMGTYIIVFKREGYEDSMPIKKTFIPNETVQVKGKLKRIPSIVSKGKREYKKRGKNKSEIMTPFEGTLINEVEFKNRMAQVLSFLKKKKFSEAEMALKGIIDDFPDTQWARKAVELLKEIRAKKENDQ